MDPAPPPRRPPADAYRGTVAHCPACGEPMRRERVAGVDLDACDACEGLWVDWFDGDVSILAAEAEAARLDRGTPPPSRWSTPAASSAGSRACPRCQRVLVAELYRFSDAKDHDLITGVEVLRCADCAGAFVPRASAHLLLDRARELRTQTLWEALVAFVRRVWGASE